jgi:thiamine-phosphate pyrophosphorylase
MAEADRPQIYLVTPPVFDPDSFPSVLSSVLDAVEVACVRLAMGGRDEYLLGRAADALRSVAHERDVALVIQDHLLLAQRHGLDGVHLSDGSKGLRDARKALGADAIVGAFCGASRHEGITAGESGADYVAFGPLGTSALGRGEVAPHELFSWWSEMIEVPVVAEGALTVDLVGQFAPVTDFFGVGDEIWASDDPVAALQRLVRAMA